MRDIIFSKCNLVAVYYISKGRGSLIYSVATGITILEAYAIDLMEYC